MVAALWPQEIIIHEYFGMQPADFWHYNLGTLCTQFVAD